MKKNGEFIGVDEKFIPENEKYVDDSIIGKNEKTKKVAKGIGIGYLCLMLIPLIFMIVLPIIMFTSFRSIKEDTYTTFKDETNDILNSIQQKQADQISSFQQDEANLISSTQQEKDTLDKETFNLKFELYSGTNSELFVTTLLDYVVTNNKTNSDYIITVIYNEINTTEPNEIIKLKKSFEQGKKYEVILDYDTKGFVNKVTIENI